LQLYARNANALALSVSFREIVTANEKTTPARNALAIAVTSLRPTAYRGWAKTLICVAPIRLHAWKKAGVARLCRDEMFLSREISCRYVKTLLRFEKNVSNT
jgi:hypothetical protein